MDRVIEKFASKYVPLSALGPTTVPQLTAGRVFSVNKTLTSPVLNKPCVYFECVAHELVEEKVMKTDQDGNQYEDIEKRWVYRYTHTRSVDFYVVDPATNTAAFCPFTQVKASLHIKNDGTTQMRPDSRGAEFAVSYFRPLSHLFVV